MAVAKPPMESTFYVPFQVQSQWSPVLAATEQLSDSCWSMAGLRHRQGQTGRKNCGDGPRPDPQGTSPRNSGNRAKATRKEKF